MSNVVGIFDEIHFVAVCPKCDSTTFNIIVERPTGDPDRKVPVLGYRCSACLDEKTVTEKEI